MPYRHNLGTDHQGVHQKCILFIYKDQSSAVVSSSSASSNFLSFHPQRLILPDQSQSLSISQSTCSASNHSFFPLSHSQPSPLQPQILSTTATQATNGKSQTGELGVLAQDASMVPHTTTSILNTHANLIFRLQHHGPSNGKHPRLLSLLQRS